MSHPPQRVTFEDLPSAIRQRVGREQFNYGFHLPDQDHYVIDRRKPPPGQAQEWEFDCQGRLLTLAERQATLPRRPEQHLLAAQGVRVTVEYRIDPSDQVLRRQLTIHSVNDGDTLAQVEQVLYLPLISPLEDVVLQVLKRFKLPSGYGQWSAEKRAAHWATFIGRLRRWAGESGQDEDIVFDRALLHSLEQADPQVRPLLRKILTAIARGESSDPAAMIASFERAVGITLPEPTAHP